MRNNLIEEARSFLNEDFVLIEESVNNSAKYKQWMQKNVDSYIDDNGDVNITELGEDCADHFGVMTEMGESDEETLIFEIASEFFDSTINEESSLNEESADDSLEKLKSELNDLTSQKAEKMKKYKELEVGGAKYYLDKEIKGLSTKIKDIKDKISDIESENLISTGSEFKKLRKPMSSIGEIITKFYDNEYEMFVAGNNYTLSAYTNGEINVPTFYGDAKTHGYGKEVVKETKKRLVDIKSLYNSKLNVNPKTGDALLEPQDFEKWMDLVERHRRSQTSIDSYRMLDRAINGKPLEVPIGVNPWIDLARDNFSPVTETGKKSEDIIKEIFKR